MLYACGIQLLNSGPRRREASIIHPSPLRGGGVAPAKRGAGVGGTCRSARGPKRAPSDVRRSLSAPDLPRSAVSSPSASGTLSHPPRVRPAEPMKGKGGCREEDPGAPGEGVTYWTDPPEAWSASAPLSQPDHGPIPERMPHSPDRRHPSPHLIVPPRREDRDTAVPAVLQTAPILAPFWLCHGSSKPASPPGHQTAAAGTSTGG